MYKTCKNIDINIYINIINNNIDFIFTRLKYLNLFYNPIGSQGAIGLAEGLKNNRTLIFLNIAKCNIENEGGIELAKSI